MSTKKWNIKITIKKHFLVTGIETQKNYYAMVFLVNVCAQVNKERENVSSCCCIFVEIEKCVNVQKD